SLVNGRDVLSRGERILHAAQSRRKHEYDDEQQQRAATQPPTPRHHCGFPVALGGGGAPHAGQPITVSPPLRPSCSRRFATSAWNCSSFNTTASMRLIIMLSTERWPEPDQFRGSATFLFAGELSK